MNEKEELELLRLVVEEYRLRLKNVECWLDHVLEANRKEIDKHKWTSWRSYFKGRIEAFELVKDSLRAFQAAELH